MSDKARKRSFHFKNSLPKDPVIKAWDDWLPPNRSFYQDFRMWLKMSSYSDSALKIYGVAARQALGFLDKPYWSIDPLADLERFRQHLEKRPISQSSRDCYHKGLKKLAEYLHLRCHKPPQPKAVNWTYYLGLLPGWLAQDVRTFITHCQRNWTTDRCYESTLSALSHMTLFLRWAAPNYDLANIGDLTPDKWFAYVDARLADGIATPTLNKELAALKHLLGYLQENGRLICERFLLIDYLEEGYHLPRDASPDNLRLLLDEIDKDASCPHTAIRRLGLMDRAWFLLMLHSALRTNEVRSLRLKDIDWERRCAHIEQSKGLKDRRVPLSQSTLAALQAYLIVRGPAQALPNRVFIFRHQPLSKSYCYERLRTYGKRCGVICTPHQLRHSAATLLLNAGAPLLSVQAIMGHKYIDTTLGYARLYDGTVASDYYAAMTLVEKQLSLPEDRFTPPPGPGQLLALVDSLRAGTLSHTQLETIRTLRAGILALAVQDREYLLGDVKVQNPSGLKTSNS
jgi:integrase